ncbi:hypothetical protein TURU_048460 [Turdus rufiventris]|nr:hypothetical protein TURU_048460 [Turdus rufiventris]
MVALKGLWSAAVDKESEWSPVIRGAPRAPVGPVLSWSVIWTRGMWTWTVRCVVGSHAGGRKWGIRRDLDGLERWNCVDLMKFNKVKDKILPLGWHNSRLGDEWSSLEEKKLGMLVDGKLNRSDSISDEGRLTDVIYLDFITICCGSPPVSFTTSERWI